jgi:outer membrane protein insertion porin family
MDWIYPQKRKGFILRTAQTGFKRLPIFVLFLTGLFFQTFAQNLPDIPSTQSGNPLYPGVKLQNRIITSVTIETDDGAAVDQQLREVILLKEGDDFSSTRLRETLQRAFQSGQISNARAFVTDDGSKGVALRFILTRQIRVAGISFDGDPVFSIEDLRPRLANLEPGEKLAPRAVEEAVSSLAALYRERGYFQTRISSSISPPDINARATLTFTIQAGPRATIGTWNIIGNLKIPKAEIETKAIKHPAGSPFSTDLIQADIQLIRELHLSRNYLNPQISEPQTTYNADTNTVDVTVRVTSGPVVEIKVLGADYGKNEQRKILPILRDGGLDDFVLEDGARQLQNDLQRKGYFFATVDYSRRNVPNEERVIVTYDVEKNRRYRVRDVAIEGTDAISYEQLADQLQTRPQSLLPPSRGFVTEDSLSRDADLITRELRNQGFLRAQVIEKRYGTSLKDDGLKVIFQVAPGIRAEVVSRRISGNRIFSSDVLEKEFPKEDPNDRFVTQDRIRNEVNTLNNFYAMRGFADARVTYRIEEQSDTPSRVSVIYEIEEGRRITINRIIINARGRTSARTLRRFLTLKEGELLRRDKLIEAEQALYATGAFRQVILQSQYVRSEGQNDALNDIILDAIEAKPFTLSYGFGYQSDDGPRGSFEISNSNMFGRLEVGSVILRLSRREQLAQVSYQFPRFNLPKFTTLSETGLTTPLLISGFFQRQQQVSFTVQRATALVQSEQRFDRQSALIYRYRFQNVRITDLRVSNPLLQRSDQPVNLGAISVTYVRDTRDQPLDAHTGYFVSADGSLASSKLGGSERFVRFLGQAQGFRPLRKKSDVTLAGRIQLGLARAYGGSISLPISERFFAGGSTTLRGLDFEQAGPRDPITDQPLGGNALIVASGELRFPIIKNLGGAVFFDTGNVFGKVSDIRFSDFTNSIGGGFRLKTPLGPFRVDAAYLIDPPFYVATPNRRLPNFQFHFSFGQAF